MAGAWAYSGDDGWQRCRTESLMRCQAYNIALKTPFFLRNWMHFLLVNLVESKFSVRCRIESGSLRLFMIVQLYRISGGGEFLLRHDLVLSKCELRLHCNLSDWFLLYSFACKSSLSLPRYLLCVQLIEKYSFLTLNFNRYLVYPRVFKTLNLYNYPPFFETLNPLKVLSSHGTFSVYSFSLSNRTVTSVKLLRIWSTLSNDWSSCPRASYL